MQDLILDDPFSHQMIDIEGGTFNMGSNDNDFEKPIHKVTLQSFRLQATPITQAQWQNVMGNNPSSFHGDNLPVEEVSWNDVQLFLKKLENQSGVKYRLPTEAEWEFAARGGNWSKGYIYSGSNDLKEVGWFWKNSGDRYLKWTWSGTRIERNNCRTQKVKSLKPNELGLYDMSGNVWEWCEDEYQDNYSKAASNGSACATGEDRFVVRGGSWHLHDYYCRPTFRNHYCSGERVSWVGFRVAMSI